ncbi:unnamed protein product [Rotaria sp. Silwood1]|nr:unnamed protein product [Rotaria sp. Silwood1]
MAWACVMPEELSIVPRGLVCLANLNTRQHPVHRSIWELLDKERANAPLRYRLVDIDEQYPRSKAKRATYEWYVPKGILKTNWMHKHLHLVPSLIVIFFELDWNDSLFKDKQIELKNKIDMVRTNLDARAAAISVVLLQNKNSFPTVLSNLLLTSVLMSKDFTNDFPLPIEFSQLSIHFNLKEYDGSANVTNSEQLKFSPGEHRILNFNFAPKSDHVQRILEIISVSLTYGTIDQTHIDFQWRTTLQINPSFQQTPLTPKWRTKAGHILWENLPIRRKINIIMRAAEVQLTVEHQLPVLLYESYPIKIRIKNCENVDIHSAILTCMCSSSDEISQTTDDTFLSYAITDSNNETTAHLCSMTFATIKNDDEIAQDLYVRCSNNRLRDITIRLSYERLNLYCMKEVIIQLAVVNPFSIQFQTMGMMMEPLASLRAQEPFILMIDTKCTSTIPITIVSSNFKPSQFIISECAIESQVDNIQLKLDEVVTEGFCLRTQPIAAPIVHNLLVGDYSLYWKRSSHPHIPELCTTFSLSDFNVEQQQVYIEVTIPNNVPLQEPFQINYRVHNRSNIVHEYKVNLEQINLIVAVSGSTMTSLLVPPHSSSDVSFTLIATLCGFVQLPKFKLSMIRPQSQEIDESIDKTLPTHIFVVPSSKNE